MLADETIHLEWQDHMYGASVGTLEVQVRSTASPTWTTVFSRTGSQGNAWNQRSMNLTSRWGQFVDIRFVATVGASFSSDIAIDDVQVRAIPFWW